MTQSRTNKMRTALSGIAAVALAASFVAIAGPASADTYVAPTVSVTEGNIATAEQIVCPGEGETPGVTFAFSATTGSVAPIDVSYGIPGTLITSTTLADANTTYEGLGSFIPTNATSYTITVFIDDGTGSPVQVSQQVTCEEVPPPTPSVVQIRDEAFCIDTTTPAGEVRVAVEFPEGAAPADLGVVYGNEQSLGGIVEVSASGEHSFQGALPVGLTPYTVVLNGLAAGEGTIDVLACETNTNPGGGDNPGTTPGGNSGGTNNPGTTPGGTNTGTTNTNANSGGTPSTGKTAPPVPRTGDVQPVASGVSSSSASPYGTILLVGGILLVGAVVALVVVSQRSNARKQAANIG